MPDYLSTVPASYTHVSPGFVETLIQSHREELFTGLMRAVYPSGEIFVFTFLDGVQQKLYRCLEQSTEVILRGSWSSALDRPDASVGFLPLSVEGIRLMWIAYEAPISQIDGRKLNPNEIMESTATWAKSSAPCILHVQAAQTNQIYLMSGLSNPVIEELAISAEAAIFSVNDASFATSLPASDYQVTRYASNKDHVTWQEYDLRLAFHPLMRIMLNRFSELAGRMLTERLCEQLSLWLQNEGWHMRVSINGVSNHQFFESVENAIGAYVGLIRCFQEEASVAIGLRMVEGISHDALLKLDSYRRDTLIRYIYNENGLDTATGRAWR